MACFLLAHAARPLRILPRGSRFFARIAHPPGLRSHSLCQPPRACAAAGETLAARALAAHGVDRVDFAGSAQPHEPRRARRDLGHARGGRRLPLRPQPAAREGFSVPFPPALHPAAFHPGRPAALEPERSCHADVRGLARESRLRRNARRQRPRDRDRAARSRRCLQRNPLAHGLLSRPLFSFPTSSGRAS
jgi:hypothetical protein